MNVERVGEREERQRNDGEEKRKNEKGLARRCNFCFWNVGVTRLELMGVGSDLEAVGKKRFGMMILALFLRLLLFFRLIF